MGDVKEKKEQQNSENKYTQIQHNIGKSNQNSLPEKKY